MRLKEDAQPCEARVTGSYELLNICSRKQIWSSGREASALTTLFLFIYLFNCFFVCLFVLVLMTYTKSGVFSFLRAGIEITYYH